MTRLANRVNYTRTLGIIAILLAVVLTVLVVGSVAQASFQLEYADGVVERDGISMPVVHLNVVDVRPTIDALAKGRQVAKERAEAARRAAAARQRVSVGGACYAEPGTPPASVLRRESGGNPRARNRSGAAGCWQFMPGTWGGYKGYASADQAPVSVQNERAKQVWEGGAGASHWRATCC